MLNNSWLRFGTSSHRISEVTTSPQHHFSHKHGALLSRRHGSANSTMLKLLQKLGPGASEAWLIFCFDLLKTSSDHWSVSWYLSFQNMGNPRDRYLWRIRYTLFLCVSCQIAFQSLHGQALRFSQSLSGLNPTARVQLQPPEARECTALRNHRQLIPLADVPSASISAPYLLNILVSRIVPMSRIFKITCVGLTSVGAAWFQTVLVRVMMISSAVWKWWDGTSVGMGSWRNPNCLSPGNGNYVMTQVNVLIFLFWLL